MRAVELHQIQVAHLLSLCLLLVLSPLFHISLCVCACLHACMRVCVCACSFFVFGQMVRQLLHAGCCASVIPSPSLILPNGGVRFSPLGWAIRSQDVALVEQMVTWCFFSFFLSSSCSLSCRSLSAAGAWFQPKHSRLPLHSRRRVRGQRQGVLLCLTHTHTLLITSLPLLFFFLIPFFVAPISPSQQEKYSYPSSLHVAVVRDVLACLLCSLPFFTHLCFFFLPLPSFSLLMVFFVHAFLLGVGCWAPASWGWRARDCVLSAASRRQNHVLAGRESARWLAFFPPPPPPPHRGISSPSLHREKSPW